MTILEASVSIPDSTERCDSNPSAPPANGKAANRTSTAAECSGERPWASGRDGDHIRTLAVDRSVNRALGVLSAPAQVYRVAIEIIFDDVVERHEFRTARS